MKSKVAVVFSFLVAAALNAQANSPETQVENLNHIFQNGKAVAALNVNSSAVALPALEKGGGRRALKRNVNRLSPKRNVASPRAGSPYVGTMDAAIYGVLAGVAILGIGIIAGGATGALVGLLLGALVGGAVFWFSWGSGSW